MVVRGNSEVVREKGQIMQRKDLLESLFGLKALSYQKYYNGNYFMNRLLSSFSCLLRELESLAVCG